jgi:hypothetical protein
VFISLYSMYALSTHHILLQLRYLVCTYVQADMVLEHISLTCMHIIWRVVTVMWDSMAVYCPLCPVQYCLFSCCFFVRCLALHTTTQRVNHSLITSSTFPLWMTGSGLGTIRSVARSCLVSAWCVYLHVGEALYTVYCNCLRHYRLLAKEPPSQK